MTSILPQPARQAGGDVAAAYLELYDSLGRVGLVRPDYRPLSARNLLGFLFRLCRTEIRSQAPWTLPTLLARYHALGIRCKTLAALRSRCRLCCTRTGTCHRRTPTG